ncbi:Metalloenzyme, LuxS/M16 peptidase-like, partial [Cinara cedri]
MLKQEEPQKLYFEEMKNISEFSLEYTNCLASSLIEYNLEDIFSIDYMRREWRPYLIDRKPFVLFYTKKYEEEPQKLYFEEMKNISEFSLEYTNCLASSLIEYNLEDIFSIDYMRREWRPYLIDRKPFVLFYTKKYE